MSSFFRSWILFGCLLAALVTLFIGLMLRGPAIPEVAPVAPLAFEGARGGSSEAPPVLEPLTEEAIEVAEVEEEEWPEGYVPGEMVLHFSTNSQLEAFLGAARRAGLVHLDAEPLLRLIRLRNLDSEAARLARSLAGDALLSYNPYVLTPEVPPLDGEMSRYRPFGDRALEWLGVPEDNRHWGEGVKVAILDTGVDGHSSLSHLNVRGISLLDEASQQKGAGVHGTAVASLLAGSGDQVRGVAPAVNLMSIQVLDADGIGDGFSLAQGIIRAVEEGAHVINLSLGTTIHSGFLQDAVNYAIHRDVVVVASAGNEGEGRLMFPARYPGVIAVGAVDREGQHVSFSNRGVELAVTAPGLGLTAAGAENDTTSFSGTSGATPLVTGSIAALMSLEPGLTAREAAQALVDHSNDAGPPGHDGYYGTGIMNVGRAADRNTRGIYDMAIADHFLDRSGVSPALIVSVQNRGTEVAPNVQLEISVNGVGDTRALGGLRVGEVASVRIPLAQYQRLGQSDLVIFSKVSMLGATDGRPWNDVLQSQLRGSP